VVPLAEPGQIDTLPSILTLFRGWKPHQTPLRDPPPHISSLASSLHYSLVVHLRLIPQPLDYTLKTNPYTLDPLPLVPPSFDLRPETQLLDLSIFLPFLCQESPSGSLGTDLNSACGDLLPWDLKLSLWREPMQHTSSLATY